MKKRITILMTTLLLTISVLSGCGAESTTTEPTETATATTTEENTTEQTEEATATQEETAEPTPEVKEESSEETTAETEPETTEPTETVEPESMEEPTPETEPQAIYTYTDMSATMYAQQTVNVRDLPDTSGNKLGSLSTNDEITISGQCNETSWYRFEYNGSVAYVSNKYVNKNKVEIQQAPASNVSDIEAYPKFVFNDMGDWGFVIWDNSCGVDYDDLLSGEPYNIFTERFPGQKVYCNAGFHIKNTTYACYFIYCDPKLPALTQFTKKYMCSCPTYISHRYVFGLEFWNERPQ